MKTVLRYSLPAYSAFNIVTRHRPTLYYIRNQIRLGLVPDEIKKYLRCFHYETHKDYTECSIVCMLMIEREHFAKYSKAIGTTCTCRENNYLCTCAFSEMCNLYYIACINDDMNLLKQFSIEQLLKIRVDVKTKHRVIKLFPCLSALDVAVIYNKQYATYLYDIGLPVTRKTIDCILVYDNIDFLKYLEKHNYTATDYMNKYVLVDHLSNIKNCKDYSPYRVLMPVLSRLKHDHIEEMPLEGLRILHKYSHFIDILAVAIDSVDLEGVKTIIDEKIVKVKHFHLRRAYGRVLISGRSDAMLGIVNVLIDSLRSKNICFPVEESHFSLIDCTIMNIHVNMPPEYIDAILRYAIIHNRIKTIKYMCRYRYDKINNIEEIVKSTIEYITTEAIEIIDDYHIFPDSFIVELYQTLDPRHEHKIKFLRSMI